MRKIHLVHESGKAWSEVMPSVCLVLSSLHYETALQGDWPWSRVAVHMKKTLVISVFARLSFKQNPLDSLSDFNCKKVILILLFYKVHCYK